MIIYALLITASLLLWASLGFPGFGNPRTAPMIQVVLPGLLLLAAGSFALAHAAGEF